MPAPYRLQFTPEAQDTYDELKLKDLKKHKRVKKALEKLRDHGPDYPALHTHKMRGCGKGETAPFISYVENHNPSAWRITWKWWGEEKIIVISIHPHPK